MAVRAEPAGHGAEVGAGVGGEVLVQREGRQVLGVEVIVDGEQVIVLGIEHEDQAEHAGEQARVDVIGAELGVAVGERRVAGRSVAVLAVRQSVLRTRVGLLCATLRGFPCRPPRLTDRPPCRA